MNTPDVHVVAGGGVMGGALSPPPPPQAATNMPSTTATSERDWEYAEPGTKSRYRVGIVEHSSSGGVRLT